MSMLMNRIAIVLSLFLISTVFAVAQVDSLAQKKAPVFEDEYEKAYQKRIKKERIYGVYIPKDLADCFIELNKKIGTESKAKFKTVDEEEAATKLHFSLGRWIIYNWGFYEGSRISHYLKEIGINHPDDQARFIIVSYHRNLNKKELNVKEQVEAFQEMRKKEREARAKKGTVIQETKRKRPRPAGQ